jgi:hypothetical protein
MVPAGLDTHGSFSVVYPAAYASSILRNRAVARRTCASSGLTPAANAMGLSPDNDGAAVVALAGVGFVGLFN